MDGHDTGYKKPPLGGRFVKGKSGNPKGRPPNRDKPTLNFGQIACAILTEEVTVKIDGKKFKVTRAELVFRQIVNQATGGSLKATQMFMQMEKGGMLNKIIKSGPVIVNIVGVDSKGNPVYRRLDGTKEETISKTEDVARKITD